MQNPWVSFKTLEVWQRCSRVTQPTVQSQLGHLTTRQHWKVNIDLMSSHHPISDMTWPQQNPLPWKCPTYVTNWTSFQFVCTGHFERCSFSCGVPSLPQLAKHPNHTNQRETHRTRMHVTKITISARKKVLSWIAWSGGNGTLGPIWSFGVKVVKTMHENFRAISYKKESKHLY